MKSFFLVFCIFLVQLVNAQVFDETFNEWPNQEWTYHSLGENKEKGWIIESDLIYLERGDSVIAHHNLKKCDNWLVSPLINITKSCFLMFDEYGASWKENNSRGVFISKGSGNPLDGDFIRLYESSEYMKEYATKKISLASYTGENVYIAFRIENEDGQYWNLNNIVVDEFPEEDLSLEQIIVEEFVTGKDNSKEIGLVVEGNSLNPVPKGTKIDMYAGNTYIETKVLEKNLVFNGKDTLRFNWNTEYGKQELKFVKTIKDDVPSNDTITKTVVVAGSNSVIESFERNQASFGLSYKTELENKYGWRGLGDFRGGSFREFILTEPVVDTLFFNKYFITDSSYFSCFIESSQGCSFTLLYSEDGKKWNEIGGSFVEKSPGRFSGKPVMICHPLSGISLKEAYLALVFNYSGTAINSIDLDYFLFPESPKKLPECDMFKSSIVLGSLGYCDLRLKLNKISDTPLLGVEVYLGTDGGGKELPKNVLNKKAIKKESVFLGDINIEKTFYGQIIPVNKFGQSSGCKIETVLMPKEVLYETDTLITFNKGWQSGWLCGTGLLEDSTKVKTQAKYWSVEQWNYMGNATRALNTWLFGEAQYTWVFSPKIVLGDTIHKDSLVFDFSLRSDSENLVPGDFAEDDSLAVVVSEDGVWKKDNVIKVFSEKDNTMGLYKRIALSLDDYADTIQIGFYSHSSAINSYNFVFIDNFEIKRVPENALLENLFINSNKLEGFNANTLEYTVNLESDSGIPVISANSEDKDATVKITLPEQLPGKATIKIIAQNSNYSNTYTIHFTREKSKNALLKELLIENEQVDDFSPATYTYSLLLSPEAIIPEVKAKAQDSQAQIIITQAKSLPGTATVEVIAEDNNFKKKYTIDFEYVSGTMEVTDRGYNIYPNPVKNGKVVVSGNSICSVGLFDINGRKLMERTGNKGGELTLHVSKLEKGIYFVVIRNNNNSITKKIVLE